MEAGRGGRDCGHRRWTAWRVRVAPSELESDASLHSPAGWRIDNRTLRTLSRDVSRRCNVPLPEPARLKFPVSRVCLSICLLVWSACGMARSPLVLLTDCGIQDG